MPKDQRIPPYLPFSSFLTGLDQLAQAMPNIIRKDVFPSHSGLLQGQLVGALKFFDLVDDNGTPKGDRLERLASEREIHQRRASLSLLLKSSYAHVIKLDLLKVTPSQLDAAFADYGITGDTKKKAKTFFLQAAKFAELNLSPLLMRRGRAPLGKKRKAAVQLPASEPQNPTANNHVPSTSRSIQLKSGITLTVTASGNLLELDGTDRELVYGIMDQIKSYS